MAAQKKHKVLRVILITFLLLIAGFLGFTLWLSYSYKSIVADRMPKMVKKATDGIYRFSYGTIDLSVANGTLTMTDVKLWPDTARARILRAQHKKVPNTLMTITIPRLEVTGINWGNITGSGAINFDTVVAYNVKWLLSNKPYPKDSLPEAKERLINKITTKTLILKEPDVTYIHHGRSSFTYYMKGGTITVNNWAYNFDQLKDTCTFLYAHSGSLRLNSFIIKKRKATYTVRKPVLDFTTTSNSVTLKNVIIGPVPKTDPATGNEKEVHHYRFPEIVLQGFNWNKLIGNNLLAVGELNARNAVVEVKHDQRYDDPNENKVGSYPQQLLKEVEMKMYIGKFKPSNSTYKATTITRKGDEAKMAFTGINGTIHNATNMPAYIARNKNCSVRLTGRFLGKSEVAANFRFLLAGRSGRFVVNGYIKDLNGEDVTPQTKKFTPVAVSHFHLKKMDFRIEGDEMHTKGNFTVLYDGLKISLLKFDSKNRSGANGPFAFIANATMIYPSNPMPGKDVRSVATSFARDTTKGFVNQLWASMFRAAEKTATRNQDVITLINGRETEKGEQPKKGLLKRLFGKKDR
ncbi:MAG: hypothetical protein K0Q79_814 [Flavipsychrobacter sp.]|jgi:hypothetical protein|nr:hypothetical protein [Flavipsychrobacter sp.]